MQIAALLGARLGLDVDPLMLVSWPTADAFAEQLGKTAEAASATLDTASTVLDTLVNGAAVMTTDSKRQSKPVVDKPAVAQKALTALATHTYADPEEATTAQAPSMLPQASCKASLGWAAQHKGSAMTKHAASSLEGCLVTMRAAAEPGLPPLYLVHAIGGGLMYYRKIVQAMTWKGAVMGVQAPKPQDLPANSASMHSMEGMAKQYLKLIFRQHPAGMPFFLGGSSFGGILVYRWHSSCSWKERRSGV